MSIRFRITASLTTFLLLSSLAGAASQTPAQNDKREPPPRVFLLNAAELSSLRAADPKDPHRIDIVAAAVAEADRAMSEGPFSVMDKSVTPPSGDKHDYMSQAPYFWADPSKPNGLPYIRRDGEHNPEIKKITDHDEFGRMNRSNLHGRRKGKAEDAPNYHPS